MLKLALGVVTVFFLAGCSSAPPKQMHEDGVTARVMDDIYLESSGRARVFFVESINGREVDNAARATRRASAGLGFGVVPSNESRNVKAEPMRVRLVGQFVVGAPIQELAMKAAGEFLLVEGEVVFTPVAGRTYAVAGVLAKGRSEVWIEDFETKVVVTQKIQSK